MTNLIQKLHSNTAVKILLFPVSLLYGLVISIRNILYDKGVFPVIKPDVPVISIGNISVGGSGKTPLTAAVAEFLKSAGKNVVIISRGYGRSSRGIQIVSSREEILLPVRKSGDEPYMLAKKLPGIPVIAAEDRVEGGKRAVEMFNPDIIVLDDAFQHRRIHRDLNIVLLNKDALEDRFKLLPSGFLREYMSSLKRADFIVFNNCPDKDEQLLNKRFENIKKGEASLEPVSVSGKQNEDISFLKGKEVFLFSGIANHEGFLNTFRRLSAKIIDDINFPDHYDYSRENWYRINSSFEKSGAEIILTTEKDYYKVKPAAGRTVPLYYLKMEMRFHKGEEIFRESLLKLI